MLSQRARYNTCCFACYLNSYPRALRNLSEKGTPVLPLPLLHSNRFRSNMGPHIMKTTIDIADDLFKRVQQTAKDEETTFRELTEQGLRLVLKERQAKPRKLPPLVTVKGRGLNDEFKDASWAERRDEIYRGHGA